MITHGRTETYSELVAGVLYKLLLSRQYQRTAILVGIAVKMAYSMAAGYSPSLGLGSLPPACSRSGVGAGWGAGGTCRAWSVPIVGRYRAM